jgi:hypothetical protein
MIQNIKINESMNKRVFESDWKQPNDESKMAKMQIKSILANAQEILDNIDVADNLDAWIQSSLTLADDYLESVKKYLLFGEDDVTVLEPIPVTEPENEPVAPQEPIMPSMNDYPDQGEGGEEVPEEMPDEVGDEDLEGEDWNEEDLEGEDLPTEETPEETPEEMMELPSEEEQEGDEITFDDIDFYNNEDSEKEKAEIENDFKDVDDEVEDMGDDEETENEDMDESFYPKNKKNMFARSVRDRIRNNYR